MLAFVGFPACAQKPTRVIDEPVWVSAPSPRDVGTTCADVHDARACWGSQEGSLVVVPRSLPTAGVAWRCVGHGESRRCRRRSGTTGAFVCDGGACAQDHPRMPDDGEWECFERDGAVACLGGEAAAAVVGGRRDEAWICGVRRTHADAGGPASAPARVCVDLAPDRPDDAGFGQCAIAHRPAGARQICTPSKTTSLGASCGGAGGATCPPGAACVTSVCVPARVPLGECWQDTDCAEGQACVFATCARRS